MPGRSDLLAKNELVQQLTELQHIAEKRALVNADTAFPAESDELVGRLRELIDSIGTENASSSLSVAVKDGDIPPGLPATASRGLSAADQSILRDHVINLNAG